MATLDDILNGSTEPAPAAAPEPTPPTETGEQPAPQPEATPTKPRDEAGRFAPKQPEAEASKPTVPPTVEQEAPEHVPFKALKDEREKRQRLERELAELRQRAQPQPATEPVQPPDFFENPEARLQYERAQVQQVVTSAKLDMSREMVRTANPDYDEAEAAFAEVAQANPQLVQQMLSAPNPALFAYQTGKQIKALQEIGDPLSYRERIEKELREKLEAEYAAKPPAQPAQPRPVLPSSLASAPAAGARAGAQWGGPSPLSALGNPALR